MPRDVTPADLEEFRRELRASHVLLPSDAAYQSVGFFNGRYDGIKPAGIIQPTSDEAVRDTIQALMRRGIRFAVRGGGHHYDGHSKSNSVVIDLSKLKQDLTPNPQGLVTIGAGNVLGEVYNAMGARNRVIPAGTSPTVGAIGHALGGGFADMAPQFGYMAQNMEQVRLVTYTGKILDINDREIKEIVNGKPVPYQGSVTGAEFMRALRGGGQNLAGIITQATFRSHDVSQHDMRFYKHEASNHLSREQAINLVTAWQNWRTQHPQFQHLVSSKLYMSRDKEGYNAEISGVIATRDPAQIAAIQRSMQQFLPQMGQVKSEFASAPQNMRQIFDKYKDTPDLYENAARKTYIVRSGMVQNALPPDGVRSLVDSMQNGISTAMYSLGGAANQGLERTSLPRAGYVVEMEKVLPRGTSNPAITAQIDAQHREVMRASGMEHVYANYPGTHGRTVTDPDLIARIRQEFDPQHIAQAPVADRYPPRAPVTIAQMTPTEAARPQARPVTS